MNCKDCCQDCQRIGCDIEVGCSGYIEPSNGTKERMDERLEMMHKLYPNAKPTNADRIRSMSDEELSYYLDGLAGDGCPPQMSPVCNKERYKCNVRKCWLKWLQQEV